MVERLTFDGNFCDIAMCMENPCKYPDGGCTQRQVWERLKAYEDLGTVEELTALKEQTRWVPVSERLPEVKNAVEGSEDVLVAIKYKDDLRGEPRTICIGFYFQGGEWWTYTEHDCGIVGGEPGHSGDTVTHWMPLPEAPKEAANG